MIKYPLNVTIDTNIFVANKFDFSTDGSPMNLLKKNIENGKIKLVLSDIVINEVEKHICQGVNDVYKKARNLRKEYLDIFPEQYLDNLGMGIYVQLPDKKIIKQKAKEVFAKFLEDCNVERLDTNGINLEKIVKDYFDFRPPFENNGKKRKEFPDAFIAEEIKIRFGTDEIVAIISQDKGFKEACTDSKNHLFFSTLGDFFDEISRNDKQYDAALKMINTNNDSILQSISERIDDNCIEVHGLSYDRDGIIVDGYDYDEVYLNYYYLSGVKIHTIDDIDGDIITASLWIHGKISVNCYFEDFDNGLWDPEEKEYIFVERRHILEKHNARFACRIEFNSKTKEIKVLEPFKIVLGGDSRESRIEIDDEQEALYKEIEDADREELGFLALSKYGDMLQDDLNESSMAQAIFKLFEEYNDISTDYEELTSIYDDIYTQASQEMEEDNTKKFIAFFSREQRIPIDFSEKDTAVLLDKIKEWLDNKLEVLTKREERNLPDYIEYGENIRILGAGDKVYTLALDELHGTPEAGSVEMIEVCLLLDKEVLAKGYVELTVGYLNFDEDGGASDGVMDNVSYEVDDVLETLEDLISDLKKEFKSEQKLVNNLKNCLK